MGSDDALYQELAALSASWKTPLSAGQLGEIALFVADVRKHSSKVNLTASDDVRSLLFRHMADGLAAIAVLRDSGDVPDTPEIVDLGSGAGFIGMALKIGWPEARVTLMEAREKRYRFLSGSSSRLGLKGLRVVRHYAGETGRFDASFDIVIERALSPLPDALRTALPMLRKGGVFAAYSSGPADAIPIAAARLIKSHSYRLPGEDKDRYLLLFRGNSQED